MTDSLRKIWLLPAFCLVLLSVSCEGVSETPPSRTEKNRTLLIYMAANNNLSANAVANLESLKQGYIPEDEGNIVVYYHIPDQAPLLLYLNGAGGSVAVDTAYRFPSMNSATSSALASAMNVTKTLFPAKDFGLVLWSHATGWLPEGAYADAMYGARKISGTVQAGGTPFGSGDEKLVKLDFDAMRGISYGKTRSFGSDDGVEMEIADLASALPYKVSFIIFDACFMGGIEVAYQLKDSTDYLLFSPTEVISTGYPYDKIAQPLFADTPDLQSVAEEFYNYYDSQSGTMRSATVSLVRTSALEQVAVEAAALFETYRDNLPLLNKNNVQGYFRDASTPFFYDLEDFMTKLAGSAEAIASFRIALDQAVVYKATTPYFINLPIDEARYSGLSTYIPDPADQDLLDYYATLAWNLRTGMVAAADDTAE